MRLLPARRVLRLSLLAIGLALGGCGDETGPGSGVAGSYHATTLTLTENGQSTNMLAQGAELTVTLAADLTTAGTLVVPAAYTESGTTEAESLAGTYTYDAQAGTVTFDHDADTYLRDVTWTVDGDRLTSTFTSGSTSLHTVLTRD
jgi:hypothetical protein